LAKDVSDGRAMQIKTTRLMMMTLLDIFETVSEASDIFKSVKNFGYWNGTNS